MAGNRHVLRSRRPRVRNGVRMTTEGAPPEAGLENRPEHVTCEYSSEDGGDGDEEGGGSNRPRAPKEVACCEGRQLRSISGHNRCSGGRRVLEARRWRRVHGGCAAVRRQGES